MGLRVNTNIASLSAQRNLSNVSERLQGNFSRLASGLRIASAADDAAGLGISERMRSQIRSLAAAGRNAQDGISLVQTAEAALNEVSANLIRMRELAVNAASGTLNSDDRATLDAEFQELASEIDHIADTTEFNGVSLLDGANATINIQVGVDSGDTITLDLEDVNESALGINNEDLLTDTSAVSALSVLDTAVDSVNTARGSFGAQQNRLSSAVRSIATARDGCTQG